MSSLRLFKPIAQKAVAPAAEAPTSPQAEPAPVAPVKAKGRKMRDAFEHFIEALHDVVSDSETDSGDDADADMTKKQMAEAVVKVGDKYNRVAAERAILAKQVNEHSRALKKLEAKNAELLAELATAKSALERVAIKNEIADVKEAAIETQQVIADKKEQIEAIQQ